MGSFGSLESVGPSNCREAGSFGSLESVGPSNIREACFLLSDEADGCRPATREEIATMEATLLRWRVLPTDLRVPGIPNVIASFLA